MTSSFSPMTIDEKPKIFDTKLSKETKHFLKLQTGTPKRRLSYNGNTSNTSTPGNMFVSSSPYAAKDTSNQENEMSPQSKNDNEASASPFIKRKCILKDHNNSNFYTSPYHLSSSNLCSIKDLASSPKNLNDSFETLHNYECLSRLPSRSGNGKFLSRRSSQNSVFSKHKSAPLTSSLMNNEMNKSSDFYQPLNDISNQFNCKNSSKFFGFYQNKSVKLSDDQIMEDQMDDVADLENLVWGNNSLNQPMNHNVIKQALEVDATCTNLIGDRSKKHILPVINGKHQDLQCIAPETLVNVLDGKYSDEIDEFIIIDSRYPYEFEGGHIKNALNIFTKDKLYEEMFIKRLNFKNTNLHKLPVSASSNCLLDKSLTGHGHSTSSTSINSMETDETDLFSCTIEDSNSVHQRDSKRIIIIFHCEFSSERGPSLLRFLRNQDRTLNEHTYPNLYYPELYLLEGGYKSFYENFKDYCFPQTYKPMLHAEHLNDLKHFRAKAKSWEVSRQSFLVKCSESRKQILLNQMAKAGNK